MILDVICLRSNRRSSFLSWRRLDAGIEIASGVIADAEVVYANAKVVHHFMLHIRDKSRMRMEIVGVEIRDIKVRRYLRSGWLEQGIKQAAFERAERVR